MYERSEEPEPELQKTRASTNSKMMNPALKGGVGDRNQGDGRPRRYWEWGDRVIRPNLCRGKHSAVTGDQTLGGLHSWVESWLKSVNTEELTPPWNTRETFLLWQKDV